MNISCWDDRSGWGKALCEVARERGHLAQVFADPALALPGTVFMRLHHHPEVRARDKAAHAALVKRPDLLLIPDERSALLYDDKLAQTAALGKWMPATLVLRSAAEAEGAIYELGLPFISKTSEGAGSHNVRFIETLEQAMAEIAQAFEQGGIPVHYGQRQRGYLLWQQFCAGNEYDFRVIAMGRERLILRRGNRDDVPFASGGNREMPVRQQGQWPDHEAAVVLAFANEFFAAEGFRWCGIDVVFDPRGDCWRVLEVTVGWPLKNMAAHRFVSGRPGAEFWPMVLDEIEAGSFA